jgi:hypothetical protein
LYLDGEGLAQFQKMAPMKIILMVLDLTDTTWLQYVEENDRIRAMLNEWSSRTAKVYVYEDMETSF